MRYKFEFLLIILYGLNFTMALYELNFHSMLGWVCAILMIIRIIIYKEELNKLEDNFEDYMMYGEKE